MRYIIPTRDTLTSQPSLSTVHPCLLQSNADAPRSKTLTKYSIQHDTLKCNHITLEEGEIGDEGKGKGKKGKGTKGRCSAQGQFI